MIQLYLSKNKLVIDLYLIILGDIFSNNNGMTLLCHGGLAM